MTEPTCPRKRSDMTPCVITDGIICYTLDSFRHPICVGCEKGPEVTGVAVDADKLRADYDAYVARTEKETKKRRGRAEQDGNKRRGRK